MWIEHNFEFTGTIFNAPKAGKNAFGQNEAALTIKAPQMSINTDISPSGDLFINGKMKCMPNPTNWTDAQGLPNWIKKDAKVLVKGKIDGRIKNDEKVPLAYFLNFSEVIPLNNVTTDMNKASARGEIYAAKHVNDGKETFFLVKEALKKLKPNDPLKFRYYRVLVPQALNLDTFKTGSRPIFYGQLARNVLPVPESVQSRIDNGENKAKFDACFAPLIVADEYYI